MLRNVLLSGSVGCAVLAVLVCVFAASSLTVTSEITDVAFRMAEQQNLRRSELLDAYIERYAAQSPLPSFTNPANVTAAAAGRQQSANAMLGLSMYFVGPQFVLSAAVSGSHMFCGVGGGIKSEQTTALLAVAMCTVLYTLGGTIVFFRLFSQWDRRACLAAAQGQVMHLSTDHGPDLCQGRMLHVLCYLNEEVDCEIVLTSILAFIFACICSVIGAIAMFAALVEIRLDNLRSKRGQARMRRAPGLPYENSADDKRTHLRELSSSSLFWAAEMAGTPVRSAAGRVRGSGRASAYHGESTSPGSWPSWFNVFRSRENNAGGGSDREDEFEPLLA